MPLIALLLAFLACLSAPAAAQQLAPDLRGTWAGERETVILDRDPDQSYARQNGPQFTSVPVTLAIEKQQGRRFFGTLSSSGSSQTIIGIVSNTGNVYAVDKDGYDVGVMIAPGQMELCHLQLAPQARAAGCTQFAKKP